GGLSPDARAGTERARIRSPSCGPRPTGGGRRLLRVLVDENIPVQLLRRVTATGHQIEHIVLSGRRGQPDSAIRARLAADSELVFVPSGGGHWLASAVLSLPIGAWTVPGLAGYVEPRSGQAAVNDASGTSMSRSAATSRYLTALASSSARNDWRTSSLAWTCSRMRLL